MHNMKTISLFTDKLLRPSGESMLDVNSSIEEQQIKSHLPYIMKGILTINAKFVVSKPLLFPNNWLTDARLLQSSNYFPNYRLMLSTFVNVNFKFPALKLLGMAPWVVINNIDKINILLEQ